MDEASLSLRHAAACARRHGGSGARSCRQCPCRRDRRAVCSKVLSGFNGSAALFTNRKTAAQSPNGFTGSTYGGKSSVALHLRTISMSSNVHTLENVRALRAEVDRLDRAVVEAAFRTIIRWTGDDPERDGLIDASA